MSRTFRTDRLTLRPHRPEDYPAMVALWSDPEVTRYILPAPATPEATWSRLLRYTGHWAHLGYGYWAVCDRSSGAYLGEMGLADYHRALDPPEDLAPEAGWLLSPAAQGQGLGYEGMSAVLAWADRELAVPRITAIIDPAHHASQTLAQRLGFGDAREVRYGDRPTLLLQRRRA